MPWSARSVCGGAGTISFSAILRSVLTLAELESWAPEPASARSGAIAVAKRGDDVACDCSFAGWFTCPTAGADDFGANAIVVDEYRTWNNSTTPIRIEPTMRPNRASEGTDRRPSIDNNFPPTQSFCRWPANLDLHEVARRGGAAQGTGELVFFASLLPYYNTAVCDGFQSLHRRVAPRKLNE